MSPRIRRKRPSPAPPTDASPVLRPCGTLQPPPRGVTVRMYRQGLGDCFLLAFATGRPKEAFYMLIDCGVILGTTNPEQIMQQVVNDISAATNGHIDLLAITHEHWDHVSGFLQARQAFGALQIHNLWLAWTEDPKDPLANQLRQEFGNQLALLRRAMDRAVNPVALGPVARLLEFFGPNGKAGEHGLLGAAADGSTRQALEVATALCASKPDYKTPGTASGLPTTKDLAGIPPVRVYVLGPPHDEKTLKRINPTKTGKEVYTVASALTPQKAFSLALLNTLELSSGDRDQQELCCPFDAAWRIPKVEAEKDPFFQQHYGFEHYRRGGAAGKVSHADAWRRVDDDWLGVAGELALSMDSYTNNTSLALAIELVPSGKVLLFAADAQVGNWLSWDNYAWNVKQSSGTTETIEAGGLLQRTVFYKVGHHGSHNATIRALGAAKKGLELMEDPALVAMIPVDQLMAAKKGWGQMPFRPLLQRLDEKCGWRVLRIDDPFPKPKPAGMTQAAWNVFRKQFLETRLYTQVTIDDPAPL